MATKIYVRYIIEREINPFEWERFAFPKYGLEEAKEVLDNFKRKYKKCNFRLIEEKITTYEE
jgi:hypothetical protein